MHAGVLHQPAKQHQRYIYIYYYILTLEKSRELLHQESDTGIKGILVDECAALLQTHMTQISLPLAIFLHGLGRL